jgi:hypothetical protein
MVNVGPEDVSSVSNVLLLGAAPSPGKRREVAMSAETIKSFALGVVGAPTWAVGKFD